MATLAGQRAQFTWAVPQYNLAKGADKQAYFARRMAKYIATAPPLVMALVSVMLVLRLPPKRVEALVDKARWLLGRP
jgi:hypothetical protein